MLEIVALGYNLSESEIKLIKRMIKNVINKDVKIIDLASYQYKEDKNNIHLIFGNKVKKLISNSLVNIFEFPSPDKLQPGKDEKLRKEAWQLLLKIKDYIPKEVIITKEKLPDLSADEVRKLEQSIKDLGHESWKGLTKDGQEILITQEYQENKNLEIIQLTFSELFAIKLAMEILNLEEINIAKGYN